MSSIFNLGRLQFQLIIPRSHDQPDNGSRIVRLGVGSTLPYRKMGGRELVAALKNLLVSKSVLRRCREFRARMLSENTLTEVCDWAEEIAEKMRR
jgi:rhamnosyltransferase subunit B